MPEDEIATELAKLAAAFTPGKLLPRETAIVYLTGLSDLPLQALRAAVAQAILQREFSSIPTVGELRRMAAESVVGRVKSWAEALTDVRLVIRGRKQLAALDQPTRLAADSLGGVRVIGASTNPQALQSQFKAAYEAVCVGWIQNVTAPGKLQSLIGIQQQAQLAIAGGVA